MTFHASAVSSGLPEHEVLVLTRPDGRYATVTCGFGRRKQPRGEVGLDNANIEFLVSHRAHGPGLANFLSFVGRLLHIRGPEAAPWAPEHRIQIAEGPLAEAGYPYIVLGWAGKVEPELGPPVCLYSPIPMTTEEKERVSIERVADWILESGAALAEERWAPFVRS